MDGKQSTSAGSVLAAAKEALAAGDYARAREKYEAIATLGSKEALLALGCIYERGGNGVEKDYDAARYWFERSWFEGKAIHAALALAKFYYLGLGVPVDFERAFSYLASLEHSNNAVALLRLGTMYELGRGVQKDLGHARSLYRRSAQLKNIFARKQLGVLEVKRGNIFIGVPLWMSAFLQGVALGFFKEFDQRLLTW